MSKSPGASGVLLLGLVTGMLSASPSANTNCVL